MNRFESKKILIEFSNDEIRELQRLFKTNEIDTLNLVFLSFREVINEIKFDIYDIDNEIRETKQLRVMLYAFEDYEKSTAINWIKPYLTRLIENTKKKLKML